VPDPRSPEDESEPVRVNLTLVGDVQGEFLLEFRRADAAVLAAKYLQQPTGEFAAEQSDALLKLIEQGMNKFCSAVAEEYGTFTSTASISSEPASDSANVVEATAGDDGGNRISVSMYLNPALAEALALHAKQVEAGKMSGETLKPAAAEERQAAGEQLNLQLVLDVELNVTLRFGQRQLALREVLELTSGSVIELDRQVEEPVELLLEGKVIARGEAVVIDGNYGLRVTEVPQPITVSVLR
jgi:flagellar motor switch protein FliN/FliY